MHRYDRRCSLIKLAGHTSRCIGNGVFRTTFSRHGNLQASLVLLVWLKKTVVNTVVLLHVDSLVLSIPHCI